jgi:hypothetical protein
MGEYKKFYADFDSTLYDLDTSEFICSHHIKEQFIKATIIRKGSKNRCNYCGKIRKAVQLHEVLKLIIIGIECIYEMANDSRYFDSAAEHGFASDTCEFNEVFYDIIQDLEINSSNLESDLFKYLNNDQIYSRKDEYGGDDDFLIDLWQDFKQVVKHEARFVFHFKHIFKKFNSVDPVEILDDLKSSILKFNLFRYVGNNDIIYRCRQHQFENEILPTGKNIASNLEINCIKQNRMSPAGISMFYGSPHKELCISEVVNYKYTKYPYYTTAIFKPSSSLKLVDLTMIPNSPSIFDKENNDTIGSLAFLRDFAKDISKPLLNAASIDYVPTQIVTEFIRYNPKLKVDGLVYPSSKNDGKENIVLFFNNEKSLNELTFLKESIETHHI